jgi:hypothetical protein
LQPDLIPVQIILDRDNIIAGVCSSREAGDMRIIGMVKCKRICNVCRSRSGWIKISFGGSGCALCVILKPLPRKVLNVFSPKITVFLKILSKIC